MKEGIRYEREYVVTLPPAQPPRKLQRTLIPIEHI